MQFADNKLRHKNVIELSFRTPYSHKADKVSELAEEACDEHFDLNFTSTFSSSVQDLVASAALKELNADKVECGMHQGDKFGASDVGELTRMKDKVNLQLIPVDFN